MTMDNRTRWFALLVLCLGTLMIVLDTTIVNVALPSIRADLGFSETSLAWVVNAYLLTFGGFLLLGGRLGDLYGHRRLFVSGITLFTIASLCCGLATSQGFLVAARAVQGLGGAVASAVALSLMMTLFTEPAERAKAMGVFGFVAAGGGSIGVLLGGILTDSLDWHWIFLVNLPIGVAVVLLSLRLLPAGRGPAGARLDVAGAVTITASLMLAVYAIVNGNQKGWASGQTLGLLVVAAALLALFIGIEARVRSPLMPLGLFRLRNVADRQHRRRPVGCRDVRLVLHLGALPATGARLHPAPGRSRLPARQPDHGLPVDRPLCQARDAVRHQARRSQPGCCWPRSGSRSSHGLRSTATTSLDVLPSMILLGLGAGHGVQPGAARRDERRRARGVRPRFGRRQHLVHDGRRARPCRPRQPRRLAHRQPARPPVRTPLAALTGGYHAAFLVGAIFAAAAAGIAASLLRVTAPATAAHAEPAGDGEAAPAGAGSRG